MMTTTKAPRAGNHEGYFCIEKRHANRKKEYIVNFYLYCTTLYELCEEEEEAEESSSHKIAETE